MLAAAYILGWCLGGLSLAMMIPAFFGLAQGEQSQSMAFMNSAVALLFLAGGLIFAFQREKPLLSRRHQLLIVLGIWFILPLGAALPFYLSNTLPTLSEAYFEGVSALTTTGFTLTDSLTNLPVSILIWRAMLQWLGGLMSLLMLSFIVGRIMGIELFGKDARSIIQSNTGSSLDIENTFRTIVPLYVGLTAACFVLLVISGLPPFDALCLSLSALSTGGYMPREGSIALYGSPSAELTLAIFMFLGAVSVIWVRALLSGNRNILSRTNEPVYIGLGIFLLGLIFALMIIFNSPYGGLFPILQGFTQGIASAASLLTTTGFTIGAQDQVVLPYLFVLAIALIGGGRYSTAGGLKVSRVLTMLGLSKRELQKLLYPHSVHPAGHGSDSRDLHVRRSVWSIFSLTLLFIVAMMTTLSYLGVDLNAALLMAVGALSNFGPAYEMVRIGSPEAFPALKSLGFGSKLVLCAGMIVGRVETLVILGLMNVSLWRK